MTNREKTRLALLLILSIKTCVVAAPELLLLTSVLRAALYESLCRNENFSMLVEAAFISVRHVLKTSSSLSVQSLPVTSLPEFAAQFLRNASSISQPMPSFLRCYTTPSRT